MYKLSIKFQRKRIETTGKKQYLNIFSEQGKTWMLKFKITPSFEHNKKNVIINHITIKL